MATQLPTAQQQAQDLPPISFTPDAEVPPQTASRSIARSLAVTATAIIYGAVVVVFLLLLLAALLELVR
jgi:hypothetical protein